MLDLLYRLKNYILELRIRVVVCVMVAFSAILISRLFVLQIVRGEDYQNNYEMKVEKTETVEATRGNIYDRKGRLLAYDELAYAVTIEDTGNYESEDDKNKKLNKEIATIIKNIEKKGDAIDNEFGIIINDEGEYEFTNSGTALQRFRADIFGYANIRDLSYNSKLKFDEAEATADDIMNYLCGKHRYNISKKYGKELQYKIAIIRYKIGLNSYQKYIATQIASDVSPETVAYIKENQNELPGVDVSEKSVRRYNDSEAFSSIIGYTGTISTEEYQKVKKKDDTVTLNDTVGKAGIEQYMNDYLMGTKGHQTVYVDSVGNLIKTTDEVDPISGGDVYLSINKDLQINTYYLLEKEIAGILYTKIQNIREFDVSSDTSASNIVIPIYDVYFALINNGLIDIRHFEEKSASDVEQTVYATWKSRHASVLKELERQLKKPKGVVYKDFPKEYREYSTYIVKFLKQQGILLTDKIDPDDETQQKWTEEELSVNDYLRYCIEQNWIDITSFTEDSRYVDTDELYDNLVAYLMEEFETDTEFSKLVYRFAILNDEITGGQLCAILFDQGILPMDELVRSQLLSGARYSYDFLKSKIKSLAITPGQLALEPCSGSSVVINVNTGEVLACVTYPGYDANRLANAADSTYYASLNQNLANPLYNNATQQRTAPGSTFKLCTSTAGLAENKITIGEQIEDLGVYEKVSNHPKCWAFPANHGDVNVSEAIRDSCNYYFYEVGWRLAGGNRYNDEKGIKKIDKYARLFGLGEKTGVEIEENESKLATEYPVMAAIGQSDNNITTIALARYVTAVTNGGKVYNLSLLDHVTDANGKTLETYGPTKKNTVDVLTPEQWNAIHTGMRMVVENMTEFDGFDIPIAGKTGTAQISGHPNHALFVGYAPYNNPKVSIATRIAYGYTSHNAAAISKSILGVYFKDEKSVALAEGAEAANVSGVSSVTD